jgi:cleavage stimulation factor subunit 3
VEALLGLRQVNNHPSSPTLIIANQSVLNRRLNTNPDSRDEIRRSYEYALNHIGHEKDAASMWTEYITFLKETRATTTWEEQQKMDLLRKAYHRAVTVPIENVEQLWTECEAFENGLNKTLAKKYIGDLNPNFVQARTTLRNIQKNTPMLYPPVQTHPSVHGLWLPSRPTFSLADKSLVGAWKTYLKWEESNPLDIEEANKGALHTRIQSTYRKACIHMRFFAEIWYV